MKKLTLVILVSTLVLSLQAQDQTVNGKLKVKSAADVGAGQEPALLIGVRTGPHIAIDNNEIGAFNNNENSTLFINASQSTSNTVINHDGSGKVGIGTSNPKAKLHIKSFADVGAGQDPAFLIGDRAGHHIAIDNNEIGAFNNNENSILYINASQSTANTSINPDGLGKVGIGTNDPKAKLHVKSGADVGRGQDPAFLSGDRAGHHIAIDNNEIGAFNNNGNSILFINASQSTSNTLINHDGPGNVGIGTANPGAWKLAVNGKIRAKEVKVETGWADFVFYDDYELPTLEEVENHIEEKGHLKDIPDAREVEEKGILLGEISSKLLQKIEELTLYTIDQEKQIKELQLRLEKVESEK